MSGRVWSRRTRLHNPKGTGSNPVPATREYSRLHRQRCNRLCKIPRSQGHAGSIPALAPFPFPQRLPRPRLRFPAASRPRAGRHIPRRVPKLFLARHTLSAFVPFRDTPPARIPAMPRVALANAGKSAVERPVSSKADSVTRLSDVALNVNGNSRISMHRHKHSDAVGPRLSRAGNRPGVRVPIYRSEVES